jgi:aminoglycoside N3'-acetyltransferase
MRISGQTRFVTTSARELAGDLRRLGLVVGDVVMVHASMRAIGPVEGGAAAVVEALDAVVGPAGTLLMNLGAWDDWDWVNERPEDERASLLAEAPAFDKDRTPADPDVGVLAEVLRQLPGTVVNNHPDARFGARGKLASALLDDAPWDDYYGAGSPLERLVEAGGKILRLGADEDTVTLLHLAENLADVPDKRRVVRHHKVLGPDGLPAIRRVSCLDDTDGIVDLPGEDYFAVILRDYLSRGRAATGLVGGARSELIDAADLLRHGTAWMTTHLAT